MPTLLVPIDFSPACENALRYANKLALRLGADIVLVQACPDAHLHPDRQDNALHRLQALAERLRYQRLTRQNGRRINYHYHLSSEPLAEGLQVLVNGYQAELVVAGLTLRDCAAPPPADEPLAQLPELVSCPVLLVPPGHHELPARVALNADFEHFDAARWLPRVAALTRAAGARFELVQFYAPDRREWPAAQKALQAAAALLPAATPHLLPEDDILEDFSEFGEQHEAQLLVLATADGCLSRRFCHPTFRRTNAYHLRVPVLVLPTGRQPSAARCAQCGLLQAAVEPIALSF
ncbi:universal stress protein [Hymenobacter sp. NST-14]|uniref:universal stress protein n=1 Tax=Hymenobacter piscis TaxID=2839984 RepID=UPI001C011BB0|nr:universal stress protein [Hymenobacter piscis]MBT9395009.1 universal stress protein [Hymenobacter piscis]